MNSERFSMSTHESKFRFPPSEDNLRISKDNISKEKEFSICSRIWNIFCECRCKCSDDGL